MPTLDMLDDTTTQIPFSYIGEEGRAGVAGRERRRHAGRGEDADDRRRDLHRRRHQRRRAGRDILRRQGVQFSRILKMLPGF